MQLAFHSIKILQCVAAGAGADAAAGGAGAASKHSIF